MSNGFWVGRAGAAVVLLALGGWFGMPVMAQAPQGAPGAATTESDPIKCWWKTDTNAVHVGQHFTLTLTCGVVETSRLTTVLRLTELDPTAVELTPFEVVDGAREEDLQSPPWRYFQYRYTLRLLGDELFGQDVDIPALNVTYNIQSAQGGGTQGRDQRYVLPPLPMRVLSLVPKNAGDIRDASRDTFGQIDEQIFRSTAEMVASAIFFGFALVLVGLAAATVARRHRTRATVDSRLPVTTVLSGCLRETSRLRSEVARDGWTPELTGRALAVFRIAGAVALARPLAQALVDMSVSGQEGQLALRKGLWRPRRALVSAPTTADAIERQLATGNGFEPRTQLVLEEVRNSLRVFNAARYGRNGHLDTPNLDAALERGTSALRRLRTMKWWPMRTAEALAKQAANLGGMVWSR